MENSILEIWQNIVSEMNNESLLCSSEKTLCFEFAWRIKKEYEEAELDFEKRLFDSDFSDGMFLDLFIENQNKKIGIEFKFMRSGSKHNSNQTDTRVKIINDIKRLTYLKSLKKINQGFFLCLTNELPYTYQGKKKVNPDFKTYHCEEYLSGTLFPTHDRLSSESVNCNSNIKFNWNGIIAQNLAQYRLAENIKFAWLNPILI